MGSPSNDPAQLLAHLFESGQAMMQFAATNAPDTAGKSDPLAGSMAASAPIVGLQQDYWKQVARFWSGMSDVANRGLGLDASGSGESDKRFANEAWRND